MAPTGTSSKNKFAGYRVVPVPAFILYPMLHLKTFLLALLLLATMAAGAQQLSLGNQPTSLPKSAVLALNSDRQGLLFPRLTDTVAINALNPADGTVIFYVPTSQLMVRNNGYWSVLVQGVTGNNYWMVSGNTTGANRRLGTIDGFDLSVISSNQERMRVLANGRVGIGIANPGMPLVVKDTIEIRKVNTSAGSVSSLLFTNTSGTGDFRIGADGGDIFWQGGGGRNLQMGSFWTTILMGDRSTSVFPAFSPSTTSGINTLIPAARAASIPLVLQGFTSQTANLMEWRNASGTALSVVNSSGALGLSTANPTAILDVDGNFRLGSKGSVNKNLVNFEHTVGSGNTINANSSLDLLIPIPAANTLTTTQATVSGSPNADLPAGLLVAWVRVSGTNQVKLRLQNLTGSNITLSATLKFYLTLIEF